MTPGETEIERTRRAILESPTGLPAGLTRERIALLGARYGLCAWCLAEVPSYRSKGPDSATCGWGCERDRARYLNGIRYADLAKDLPELLPDGWTVEYSPPEDNRPFSLYIIQAETGYRCWVSGWGRGDKRTTLHPEWAPRLERDRDGHSGREYDPTRYDESRPETTTANKQGAKGVARAFKRLLKQTNALDLWARSWEWKHASEAYRSDIETRAKALADSVGGQLSKPYNERMTREVLIDGEANATATICDSGDVRVDILNCPDALAAEILRLVKTWRPS